VAPLTLTVLVALAHAQGPCDEATSIFTHRPSSHLCDERSSRQDIAQELRRISWMSVSARRHAVWPANRQLPGGWFCLRVIAKKSAALAGSSMWRRSKLRIESCRWRNRILDYIPAWERPEGADRGIISLLVGRGETSSAACGWSGQPPQRRTRCVMSASSPNAPLCSSTKDLAIRGRDPIRSGRLGRTARRSARGPRLTPDRSRHLGSVHPGQAGAHRDVPLPGGV